ncbi:MAG: hypothetical protein ACYTAS_09475 [Planctomycetota bacterium]|jgi:hypothetical protein
MKRASIFRLIVGVLLLAGAAEAGITTIQNTVDHTANEETFGVWFTPPDAPPGYSPYYRGMWEDWGWTHDLKPELPHDALGIESATLEVQAWNVKANSENPEIDIIYANGIELGMLEDTGGRQWKSTSFALPPAALARIWVDGEAFIYMDIDAVEPSGHRVSLRRATLTVNYLVSGEGVPLYLRIHRFWSPVLISHFYTGSEEEKDQVLTQYPDTWIYEGVAYHALPSAKEPNSAPVYRFWSDVLGTHFYTMDEKERDKLINEFSDVWTYERIEFYAFPVDQQPKNTFPVHRFWSDSSRAHFYTMDEEETDKLITEYPDVWTYEGIAWYAYK